MRNIDKVFIVIIVLMSFFLGMTVGINNTEFRLKEMAKKTGIIFLKNDPYKISPIKEIPIEIKAN